MNYNLKTRETPDRLLDRIVRTHNTPTNSHKIVFLVEGWYDVLFYEQFCVSQNVYIHNTDGSEKMDSLIPQLKKRNYMYLAIQDSDFETFGLKKNKDENLFFTDYHDYEMTCFSDSDFSRRFSDEIKNNYNVVIDYSMMSDDLFLLSCYKACNMVNSLKVSFKLIDTYVPVLRNIGHYDIQKYIDGNLQQGFVQGFIRSTSGLNSERYHLHNGHDWLNRICYYVNNNSNSKINEDTLQEMLRNLYLLSDFCKTQLYQSIALWENAHKKVWIDENK